MSTVASPRKSSKTLMHSNPVLSKLSKVKEVGYENTCTYSGIFTKTMYFLLITIVSVMAYAYLCSTSLFNTDVISVVVGEGESLSLITFGKIELIGAGVAALLSLIMPFICAFSIGATPVCGTLYCAGEGYLLSMLVFKLLKWQGIDASIGLVALLLTIMVVAVMAFLYTRRIVKVDNRFMVVLFSICGAVIVGGLLVFVLTLIPFTRPLIISITSNPVIGIACSGISVVLASLFLLSDFAVIENCVTCKMPSRYEWMASFGLAFTVLWLYLKILELLVRILGKNKD